MKKTLKAVIAVLMLASLPACMIIPLDDRPYYGGHSGHHQHHHRDYRGYGRYR